MTPSFRKAVLLIAVMAMVPACGVIKKDKPKATPTIGNRIAVLSRETDLSIDPATAAEAMTLPEATANDDWGQAGGGASKAPQHVALGAAIKPAFSVSIGEGTSKDRRLGGGPVVAGGKVFTIDTKSVVRAFDATSGAKLWESQFGTTKRDAGSLFGGGVASDGTNVYATNGLGFVASFNAATGARQWQVRPNPGALRGAPTLDVDTLYVMSQDNQIYSLKAADGSQNWSNAAALQIAGVFGSSSPAVGRGTIVAGFSSGELNGYRYENGRQVWQDSLARTSITTGVADLLDIDASPVIHEGMVYALGQGGRLVALDLTSGQRVWELNMAGISTPWVAGDWLFAISDKAQLVGVNRLTGKVRWINQLPRYRSDKKETGPIFYYGPVLAGGRLLVTGSNGSLIYYNPVDGSFLSQANVGAAVRFQPVVAKSTLYLLTDAGRLIAMR